MMYLLYIYFGINPLCIIFVYIYNVVGVLFFTDVLWFYTAMEIKMHFIVNQI